MISYYKSKHPGLVIYLILITISVLSFLLLEVNTQLIGVLSVMWGGFIFMRTLSLYEVTEHNSYFTKDKEASKNHKNSALPHDLLHLMNGKNHMKRGMFAMNATHERTVLWLVLGSIYSIYTLYISKNTSPVDIIIQNLSILFMTGSAFWAGQTYAYSDKASKAIISICGFLFALTIFTVNDVNTANILDQVVLIDLTYYMGNTSTILLSSIILYSAIVFLYSFKYGLSNIINACIGLSVIILLVISNNSFEHTPNNIATWISGWSLISVFWIRAYSNKRKIYTLYQCE